MVKVVVVVVVKVVVKVVVMVVVMASVGVDDAVRSICVDEDQAVRATTCSHKCVA